MSGLSRIYLDKNSRQCLVSDVQAVIGSRPDSSWLSTLKDQNLVAQVREICGVKDGEYTYPMTMEIKRLCFGPSTEERLAEGYKELTDLDADWNLTYEAANDQKLLNQLIAKNEETLQGMFGFWA